MTNFPNSIAVSQVVCTNIFSVKNPAGHVRLYWEEATLVFVCPKIIKQKFLRFLRYGVDLVRCRQGRGPVSWTIESLIHILFLANLLHMSQMFSYCAASTLPPFRGEKIYCCFGTIPLKSKR